MKNNIVRKHKDSCKHNAKVLADKIYYDLKKMNYTDNDLIEVYKDMSTCSLSTYELERLTKKQLYRTFDGYRLRYVNHDKAIEDNVNLIYSRDSIILEELKLNGCDASLLETVKTHLPTAVVSADILRSSVRTVLEFYKYI